MEFLIKHLEAIASVFTILGGACGIGAFMMRSIRKEFNPRFKTISDRFDILDREVAEIRAEQMRFHTRLTWLDGYLTGHDPNNEKRWEK